MGCSRVIKEVMEELLVPLRIKLNSSLEEGIIQEKWKIAHLTPVLKKGSKGNNRNYIPLSLTDIFSKIMES